jgi:hypothetical protein
MPGPAPKPKRRRRNVPASYGLAQPTSAPAAEVHNRELGIDDPHPLVASMWTTVQLSCEAQFFSEADWARFRLEMWHANTLLTSGKPISSTSWARVQVGLSDMLVSPMAKRKLAVEMQPAGPDSDEIVAVSMMSTYKAKMKSD